MSSSIDLHTHTLASDGTLEPGALLEKAHGLDVRCLAIADHDTTAGYETAVAQLHRFPGLELIPAVEINAEGALPCHLLGYFIDIKNPAFQAALASYRAMRVVRARAMVQKLRSLGIALDFSRVEAIAKGGSLGRPHIADALIAVGVVGSRQAAFDRFLKKDAAAYVPGDAPSAAEAIQLIRQAGGIPVLAHPCYDTSDALVEQLVSAGLLGIEAYYPEHSRSLVRRYLETAARLGLAVSGGSDFHGPRTGRTSLACVDVPDSTVQSLREARLRL